MFGRNFYKGKSAKEQLRIDLGCYLIILIIFLFTPPQAGSTGSSMFYMGLFLGPLYIAYQGWRVWRGH